MTGRTSGRTLLGQSLSRAKTPRGLWQLPIIFLGLVLFVSVGCNSDIEAPSESSTSEDGKTASEIFSQMVKTYRNANQYSDQGVLYMSYRLNGRPVQEPQPWAVAVGAQGEFSADLFNAQIRCDGKLLSCYVYDIESANLDNQRLLLPVTNQLPLEAMFNDAIARHFITGYSEMPLNTSPDKQTPLIPPTIGLLTGQVEPEWLQARLERFEDSEIDGRGCYVIRCWKPSEEGPFVDLWIDKENSIIWQAAIPTDCLDEKVRTSAEITELRMVARFHDASFENGKSPGDFALKKRSDATPVSRFVKIPDALPSELIGNSAPKFNLLTQSGEERRKEHFLNKTTTLMWIGDNPDLEQVYKFDALAKEVPGDRQNYGVIYSEPHRASYESDIHAMNMALNEVARNTKMPFYYDQDLATSMLFGLKAIPCLVVLDKGGKVQFARHIEGEWAQDTKAAIERVNAGEDVASEMLSDYTNFLDAYHRQLLVANAAKLLQGSSIVKTDAGVLTSKARAKLTKTWTNSQFKMPGNILAVDGRRLFVLDGWRTVVQLDENGSILGRLNLELPEDVGVSVWRMGVGKDNEPRIAAFMPGGNQVFIFDRHWNILSVYPETAGATIRDAGFFSEGELGIAYADGLRSLDLDSGKVRNVVTGNIGALGLQNQLFVQNERMFDIRSQKQVFSTQDRAVSRILTGPDGALCVGPATVGSWTSMFLDEDHNIVWSSPVGPQQFDSYVEPISRSESGICRWAIASSDGNIRLLDRNGVWIGDCETNSEIEGICLVTENDQQRLVVATKDGVTNWQIDFDSPRTLPVSHQRSR